jgi:hypothetical protein
MLLNGTAPTSGRIGQTLHFNGIDGGVQISNPPSPGVFSIAAWVRFDSLESSGSWPGLQYLAFRKNSRTHNFEAFALAKARDDTAESFTADRFMFAVTAVGGENCDVRSITRVVAGECYFVVGTFDGTWARLYINGVQEARSYHPLQIDYGDTPMYFGTTMEPWDGRLLGTLNEVALFDGALTPDQITSIYKVGRAGKDAAKRF